MCNDSPDSREDHSNQKQQVGAMTSFECGTLVRMELAVNTSGNSLHPLSVSIKKRERLKNLLGALEEHQKRD